MRAIVLDKFGDLDSLVIKEIPEPEPKVGYVVIEVKAFGINHAEIHMRRGEWAEAAPVSGIASPWRPILLGRLVRGTGSDPRFQPAAADGKWRLPDILRKLCFRNSGISPFGRASSANRC